MNRSRLRNKISMASWLDLPLIVRLLAIKLWPRLSSLTSSKIAAETFETKLFGLGFLTLRWLLHKAITSGYICLLSDYLVCVCVCVCVCVILYCNYKNSFSKSPLTVTLHVWGTNILCFGVGPIWTHITITRHEAQSLILSSSAVTGVHFQTNLGVSDMDINQ